MPEKTALANYTIRYRQENKESQFDFADHCGISKDTLSLIERCEANPTLETIQKIAAYTGGTVAEILTVKTRNERGKHEISIYHREKYISR